MLVFVEWDCPRIEENHPSNMRNESSNSDPHGVPTFLNFIELMQLPGSATGAVFTCTFPVLFGSQIAVPEGPSSTLSWAGFVNVAFA